MVLRLKDSQTPGVTLRNFSDIGYTAEDRYAAYFARVDADGGEVVDSAAALAAIRFDMEQGTSASKGPAVCPAWGVKKSGTPARIDKLYSLTGAAFDIEGVAIGTGGAKPLAEVDAAGNPIAIVDVNSSRIGGYLRTISDFALVGNATDWFGIYASMSGLSPLSVRAAFGNLAQGNSGRMCAGFSRSATLTSYSGQIDGYDPLAPVDDSKRLSQNINTSAYASTVGMAMAMQISTGRIKLIVDGRVVGNQDAASDAELFNYIGFMRKLYFGIYYDGTVNPVGNIKGEIREAGTLAHPSIFRFLDQAGEMSARYAATP